MSPTARPPNRSTGGFHRHRRQYPSPDQVTELENELKARGKTYEFHSYEGAGNAFFAVNRPSYRPEAAMDGWQRIRGFFGQYLS